MKEVQISDWMLSQLQQLQGVSPVSASILDRPEGQGDASPKRRYYVYIYSSSGVPFYVGKGSGARAMDHLHRDDFPPMEQVNVQFLGFEEEKDALRKEAELIALYGVQSNGGLLRNKVSTFREEVADADRCVQGNKRNSL